MTFHAELVEPMDAQPLVVVFSWAGHEIFRWTVSVLDQIELDRTDSPDERQRLVDLFVTKQLAKVWHAHPG